MTKIRITHDEDVEYGYPVGTELTIEQLFSDFRDSADCDEKLYRYLCGIPTLAAVDEIADIWGISYEIIR